MPFFISFLFFFSFYVFPPPFVVLRVRVPLPFSFFLSFRFVVFPFVSCIAFFAFLFASLLSLVADSVILLFRLGVTPPPALLASLKYAYRNATRITQKKRSCIPSQRRYPPAFPCPLYLGHMTLGVDGKTDPTRDV